MSFKNDGKKVVFETDFLKISFEKTGIEGSCPAQKENDGCYFIKGEERFCPAEIIKANKEFCDCEFEWRFSKGDAKGKSIGKTPPAHFEEEKNVYPKQEFSAKNAAAIEAQDRCSVHTALNLKNRVLKIVFKQKGACGLIAVHPFFVIL